VRCNPGLFGLIGGVVVSAVHRFRHIPRSRPIIIGLVAGALVGGGAGILYVLICYFTFAY